MNYTIQYYYTTTEAYYFGVKDYHNYYLLSLPLETEERGGSIAEIICNDTVLLYTKLLNYTLYFLILIFKLHYKL